jgi:UDP-glucose 4-epimerase
VFNIGPKDDGVTVARIAEIVCEAVSPGAEIVFGRDSRGWVGDVPRFRYSTARLSALGWNGADTSEQTIRRAVGEILRSRAV